MDWLKELLEGIKVEDNKIDVVSLQKSIEKKIKETTVNKEDYENLEIQLNTANETIEGFKGVMTKQEVEQLKATYEAEIKQIRRDSIDERLLTENRARNKKATKALLEEIEEEDDEKYESLRLAQIKKLQEDEESKFLFEEVQETKVNFKGVNPAESNPVIEKAPRDFTYEDWCNQLEN
ncbi:scaffold protein [Clostridioides difficile]|uniref:phage scaffolding protein n=1 Tax=Clostridioides difficile TaxID=1496 RepID=UPI001026F815|nr:phage scaffolding protein [Clostridioides difficile]VFF95061.1 scaffold protein [Clostridioides difficile]VIF97059.1 scaffold protein [Clostridioides difficile]HBF4772986.1 phage scaffolding protein [Clostridioides difficile]HBF5036929.1 phage scaffolding protein [Clostridioides difficile]HBF5409541.1 phage scaffolding protein [Clostridioides difficile]